MTEEIDLLKATIQGNPAAFEQIVSRYQTLVCAITYSGTGRLEASEELAQETFLLAWRDLIQLKDLNKFRSWLCTIARNRVRNHYRTRLTENAFSCDAETMSQIASQKTPEPSEHLISQEEEMILSQALMQIPEEYREPLVLYYRQQQSTKEVAESLELNEATVRTRLSRGRQMLKDQVATMVERTLEKTGPSKKFTKAVMVAIGAGLAAGTAATAGMAAAGTATGVSTATTGILTTTIVKVTAIAAAVILTTGVAIYSYSNSQKNSLIMQPTQQESAIQTNPSAPVPSPVPVVQEEIKPKPVAEQTQGNTLASEKQTETPQEKTKVRHPNWPGINEPIKYVYAQTHYTYEDETEKTEKFWARLPDAFRDERQFNKITIDNGKQRLILDPNTKQAQIEPTWYKDGKMIWQFQQSLEEHPIVKPVTALRDPNSNPEIILTKLIAESNVLTTVYDIKDNKMNDPNGIQIKLWIDNRTLLPEKMEGVVIGEPNQFDNIKSALVKFDFSPFSDSIFSTNIPVQYKALPDKQHKGFSGQTIDLLGNPIAGVEVYLYNWTLGNRSPYKTTSDQYGNFSVILPQPEYGFNSTISLWAKLTDNPAFIGWTLLLKPDQQASLENSTYTLGGTIPGNPGVVYHSEDYLVTKTDQGIMTQGSWCIGASDIILVMEPSNKVFGWVRDTLGNAVPNAKINVSVGSLTNQHGYQSYIRLENPKDIFATQTNEQGYYEIEGIPKLWNKCKYEITVTPQNDGRVGDSRTIVIDDPNQPIQTDFVLLSQGPTVQGLIVDNYGTPLCERYIRVFVNGKYIKDFLAKTDKKGRFEFKHCPADAGLQIKAVLSENSMNTPEKERSYVFYPDVTVDVGYQPGQDEYEVKLVAIKPEIEIDATLIDSAGNPLPYFPVELFAREQISREWQKKCNFIQRTDENGHIKFKNVPEINTLRLICSVSNSLSDNNQTPQMKQYLKELGETYKNYHWTEAIVPLEPGKKKYQITVTIPTEEEYKQQKESQEK